MFYYTVVFICIMYIVFFLLSRPPWKSAIAEGVSVNKYSFNNNNKLVFRLSPPQRLFKKLL